MNLNVTVRIKLEIKLNFFIDCKKVNINQKEILETVLAANSRPSLQSNPSSNFNTLKSPNKEDRRAIERKPIEKRLTSANPQAHYSTNNEVKKSCICQTNFNENVIKNNICSLCNRYVDGVNTHGDSIKKRYQQQESRPR
jgi:hypothetical protein